MEHAMRGISGQIAGTITAKQLDDVPCSKVKLRASAANSGNVYIGFTSGVQVVDGANDEVTGYQLDAGQDTGWLPIDNLNKIWRICDNPGDTCTYIGFK